MRSNNPKLSVVVPTYNRVEMLKRVIEGILNQTFRDYETIVVDDGSTDVTESVIRELIKKTPCELQYLKQVNKGAGAARNLGIKHAKGELVLFIDDDVLPTPGLIEEHVRAHQQYTGDNIAIVGSVVYSSELNLSPFMQWLINSGIAFGHSREQNGAKLDYRSFCTANLSLKRCFVLEKGMFDENFRQFYDDIELGFRLEQQGLQVVLAKNALGYHLRGETVQGFCNRSKSYGQKSVLLYKKWPALKSSMNPTPQNIRTEFIEAAKKVILPIVIPVLRPALCWLDSHDYAARALLYALMLDYYSQVGFRKGIKSVGK